MLPASESSRPRYMSWVGLIHNIGPLNWYDLCYTLCDSRDKVKIDLWTVLYLWSFYYLAIQQI